MMENTEALVTQEPAFAEIRDLLSTADGQKKFLDWFHDPTTRSMLMAARVLAKPRPMSGAETADYLLGETCGAHKIIDFLIGPQNYISRTPVTVKPEYGARTILQQEG